MKFLAHASRSVVMRTFIAVSLSVALPAVLVTTATGSSPTTTTTSTSTTSTLAGATTTTLAGTSTTTTTSPVSTTLPWPFPDSAALAVPSLSVSATSPNQPRVPIASLTKLMTTWVVLQRFPLEFNQGGPCTIVTAQDVAFFHENLSIQESTAKIALGERLCEGTLLRGLLVHSSGDYAQLLVQLTGMSTSGFVNKMNTDAVTLGLTKTHYADFTGISPSDLSTAGDVTALTVDLMTNEPIIDGIAKLTKVDLPVAGWLGTYTPLLGTDGVVGVKSGYTLAAGGCVAMAINVKVGGIIVPTYEVVLSQPGGNALNVAADHAIDLMKALRASMRLVATPSGRVVQWVGSASLVTPTTTTTSTSTTTTTTSTSTTTTTTP